MLPHGALMFRREPLECSEERRDSSAAHLGQVPELSFKQGYFPGVPHPHATWVVCHSRRGGRGWVVGQGPLGRPIGVGRRRAMGRLVVGSGGCGLVLGRRIGEGGLLGQRVEGQFSRWGHWVIDWLPCMTKRQRSNHPICHRTLLGSLDSSKFCFKTLLTSNSTRIVKKKKWWAAFVFRAN